MEVDRDAIRCSQTRSDALEALRCYPPALIQPAPIQPAPIQPALRQPALIQSALRQPALTLASGPLHVRKRCSRVGGTMWLPASMS